MLSSEQARCFGICYTHRKHSLLLSIHLPKNCSTVRCNASIVSSTISFAMWSISMRPRPMFCSVRKFFNYFNVSPLTSAAVVLADALSSSNASAQQRFWVWPWTILEEHFPRRVRNVWESSMSLDKDPIWVTRRWTPSIRFESSSVFSVSLSIGLFSVKLSKNFVRMRSMFWSLRQWSKKVLISPTAILSFVSTSRQISRPTCNRRVVRERKWTPPMCFWSLNQIRRHSREIYSTIAIMKK